MTTATIVFLVAAFGALFVQSLVGFGSAMIAMGIMTPLLSLSVSAPLVAMMAVTLEAVLLFKLRSSLKFRAIWPLVAGSIVGIPIGVLAIQHVDERIALAVLGCVITGYVAYACVGRRLAGQGGPVLPYGAGVIAGILGGAYNTSGPPVILYGDFRGWRPAEFKSNLQGYFVITDTFIVLVHAAKGNITETVWTLYALMIVPMAAAIWLGLELSRRIDEKRFRQLTLGLLMLIGLRLILGL